MIHPLKQIHSRMLRVLVVSLATLIILLAIVAVGAQFLAGYLLRDALVRAGNDLVTYEDIDLNVFTGTFGIYGLYVGQGPNRVLEAERAWLNLSMSDLLGGRLRSQSIELEGAYLRIDDADGLRVAGVSVGRAAPGAQKEPSGQPPSIPVFGTDQLVLTDGRVGFYFGEQKPLILAIDSMEASHFVFDADASPASVALVARVGDGRIELSGELSADARRQQLSAQLKISNLALQQFTRFGGAGIDSLTGRLDLDYRLDFSHAPDTSLEVVGEASLRVADLHYGDGNAALDLQALSWNGEQSLALQAGERRLETQGKLELQSPRVVLPNYRITADTAVWEGGIEGALLSEGVQGLQEGKLTVTALTTELASGTLSTERLAGTTRTPLGTDDSVTLDSVEFTAVTYEDKLADRRLIGMQSLRLPRVELDRHARSLSIDAIVLTELDAILNVTPEGHVRGVRNLVAAFGASDDGATAAQAEPADARPWQARIGGITLAGASRFRFEDDAVEPPVTVVMRELSGSAGALDSSKPEVPTPVKLSGRVDEYGSVSLEGDLFPFAARPTAAVQGKVESIDLARFSPYMQRSTGYGIRSGQLNAAVAIDLDQGIMDGEIDLRLRSPDFEPVNEAQVARFNQRVTMPLELMVATLVDKDGDLSLEIPISGDVSDPQFSGQDVFRLAAAKAMQATALNYLKNTLQPYGSLITVIGLAGKAAGHVALEPVLFDAGQVELSTVATDYLDKVAELMSDRGGLRIKLCGMAVPADREPLELPAEDELTEEQRERLLALARERALAIKAYLVERDGVKVDHLFICTPEVASDPEALPRVKLEL